MIQLVQPDLPELWLAARRLVEEYAASLNVDLCFQDLPRELETCLPDGRFILAGWNGPFVGCGGLRRVSDSACEMKRLYVNPTHRGKRIGEAIAETLIAQARDAGGGDLLEVGALRTVKRNGAIRDSSKSLRFVKDTE